jgi:DNA polymerase III delta subunit
LESIYDRLLETDIAIKTGKLEANLALDMLVVELARVQ